MSRKSLYPFLSREGEKKGKKERSEKILFGRPAALVSYRLAVFARTFFRPKPSPRLLLFRYACTQSALLLPRKVFKRRQSTNTGVFLDNGTEELRRQMIIAAKEGIKSSYASEEYALIQAVNAINELNRSYNLSFERLSEWFGIYFPEVRISNPSSLSKVVHKLSTSGSINRDELAEILGEEMSDRIYEKISESIGRKMGEEEMSVLSKFTESSDSAESLRKSLEDYIKSATERLLPNTVYLTDNMVAAELLSKAGSLDRLVLMPAGTIQLLGAEKALFKHIKFGSKPPKYGVLFRLPAISQARPDVRGKMARAYSAKIATALKADVLSKRFIAPELKAALDKSIERIMSQEPKPKAQQHRSRDSRDHGKDSRDYGHREQPRHSAKRQSYPNRDTYFREERRPNRKHRR
jgi:Protein implicated in ribosomal biogenesis, Nop56p homolog